MQVIWTAALLYWPGEPKNCTLRKWNHARRNAYVPISESEKCDFSISEEKLICQNVCFRMKKEAFTRWIGNQYVFLLAYFHFLSVLLSSEGNKEGNAVNHSRLDDFEHTLFFLYNSLRRSELEIKHRHNSLKPACVHLLSWFKKKKNSLNLRISILKHRKKFRNSKKWNFSTVSALKIV